MTRFFPTVWSLVKRWADPETVSKFMTLSPGEVTQTLKEYVDVENLPRKYGGLLNFEHGMQPVLDARIEEFLQWSPEYDGGLPCGPLKWRADSRGGRCAVAVGSVEGRRRESLVATLSGLSGSCREPASEKLNGLGGQKFQGSDENGE